MRSINRYFKTMFKRASLVALFAAALILPASSMAASAVTIEGSIGVANVTAGDTTYAHQVNASYDQVVKFQVFYHNHELPDSGLVAKNLTVKIAMPTTAGTVQTVNTTIKADNSNVINDSATVNLNRADATIDYIPGSAVWKHNIGTNAAPNVVETSISDAIVTSPTGLVLEDEQPCFNFAATVTVLARVHVPAVTITKKVRPAGNGQAVTQLTANPGDRLEYLLTAKNAGNQTLTNLILRDSMPAGITFVPGSVTLFTGTHPNGVVVNNDALFHGGVNAGTVGPGGTVFITFVATVDPATSLACGANNIRNIAVVDTDQTGEYNNSATVTANKQCANTPPTTTTQLPNTGPGEVFGLFGATSAIGAVAHSLRRRFNR